MQSDFLHIIQSHVARIAVGPSTVRGSPRKTCEKARARLQRTDLRAFGTTNRKTFEAALNKETERLRCALPKRTWGLARKVLNIFLRDCFYNVYLAKRYHLELAEQFYELPLDSITARKLKARHENLPDWQGVGKVKKKAIHEFQKAALTEATDEDVARVHLDALWWSFSRDKKEC